MQKCEYVISYVIFEDQSLASLPRELGSFVLPLICEVLHKAGEFLKTCFENHQAYQSESINNCLL